MQRFWFFQFLIVFATCSEMFNVGTVLWRKSDGVKHCWSASEKDLLIARRIMQGLLPDPQLVDFTTEHAISTLLEYFRMSFEVIKDGSTGETQEHLLRSLADAVGGYLTRIALPISRHLFYAGRSTFEETSTVHLLYEDLKQFLKTSGQGWKKPDDSDTVPIAVPALEVNTDGDRTACDNLIFEESEHQNQKNKTRSEGNITTVRTSVTEKPNLGNLPLPVLDDSEKPTAMAIPLKDTPLISLSSKESAFLIPKYYSYAVKCISAISETKDVDLSHFNSALYGWLINEVLPHLNDNNWYVGFGGVLRVVQAIKASGIDTSAVIIQNKKNVFFFENGVAFGEKVDKKLGLSILKKSYDFLKSHAGVELFVLAFLLLTIILAMVSIKCLGKNRPPSSLFSSIGERVSSVVFSMQSSKKAEEINKQASGTRSALTSSFPSSNIRSTTTNSSKETQSFSSHQENFFQQVPCNSDFISRLPKSSRSFPSMKRASGSSSSTDGDTLETESAGASDTNSESAR